MKRRYLLILLSIALLALFIPSAGAQEGSGAIAYGETVSGEVSDQAFEVPFVFTGAANDVVVAQLQGADGFDNPMLILLDAENNILANVRSYNQVTLAAALPTGGQFTILASRDGGRTGRSGGKFDLTLLKPPVLTAGAGSDGIVAERDATQFFVVDAEGAFTLNYERTQGEVGLQVVASQMRANDNENFEEILGVLEGMHVNSGSLNVVSSEEGVFLVRVAASEFYYSDAPANTSFTLTLR